MKIRFALLLLALAGFGTASAAPALECAVETDQGVGQFQADACFGFWYEGPTTTYVYFDTNAVLGGLMSDATSQFYWSDARCPNFGITSCILPIEAFIGESVTVSVVIGGQWQHFSAVASYETGQ